MSFYCPNCEKTHSGWPSIEFAYPEEYCHMNEKEREVRCFIISDGLQIDHKNHAHYYAKAYWPQKVKDSSHVWDWKVWVMVQHQHVIKELREGVIPVAAASLQSNFPWYGSNFLKFPVEIMYDCEHNFPIVTKMIIEKTTINKDFTEGLPLEIATDWSKDIVENGQWQCDGKAN